MAATLVVHRRPIAAALAAGLVLASTGALADHRADIGYTQLQQEFGGWVPTGAGVLVSQVEGTVTINEQVLWLPDVTNAEFAGKTIRNASYAGAGLYSGHATAVGQNFYGLSSSIAPGITNIDAFSADHWIGSGLLLTIAGTGGPFPKVSTSRIANHSWVGSTSNADTYVLRRVDWLVETDEYIHVVGLDNGTGNSSTVGLLASAYNVIAVGLSNGMTRVGSVAIDTTYTAGRTRPDIVDPSGSTSLAVPNVSAAIAMLVELGNANPGLSTDPVSTSTTNRAGATVRNAERSEVIRAALMAGADRVTHNTAPNPTNLAQYRGAVGDQTANGLDRRYGAGQLNIWNSFWIITEGEQGSVEDGNVSGSVTPRGFDYDPAFGGSGGSNSTATYPLPVQAQPSLLTASLVWNLDITGGSNPNSFNPAATLRDLNVSLIDLANGNAEVATSASTLDNTENLWIVIPPNAQYALRVTRVGSSFNWDYGLAWQLLPDTDEDGVYDDMDNCINVANPNQIDSDADGYGNFCDGDLNNNGYTNVQDYGLFRLQLGQASTPPTYNPADINVNGAVNVQDYGIFRDMLGMAPGPSGIAP